MVRAFGELSERSRYERFFTKLTRLSDAQLRYLTEVDHRDHSAWVAVTDDHETPRGLGVARWVRLETRPDAAEVAVTVIDAFQRRGIGRSLLYLAARAAREREITIFRASVLADNRATLQMLEKMGADERVWHSGVLELEVPIDRMVSEDQLVPLKLEPHTGQGETERK